MAIYQVSGEHILRWSGQIEADNADDAQAQLVDSLNTGQAELVDWKYEVEKVGPQ